MVIPKRESSESSSGPDSHARPELRITSPAALKPSSSRLTKAISTCKALGRKAWPILRWRKVSFEVSREAASSLSERGERYSAWSLSPQGGARISEGAVGVSFRVSAASFPFTVRLQCDLGSGFREGLDIWVLVDSPQISNRVVHFPARVRGLRLLAYTEEPDLTVMEVSTRELGKLQRAMKIAISHLRWALKNPRSVQRKAKKALALYRQGGLLALKERLIKVDRYPEWVQQYDTRSDEERAVMRSYCESLTYKPLVSVVLPVYNVPERFLRVVIESVIRQIYPNWELCIADDNSPNQVVRDVIKEYAAKDSRIKYLFREANGHIAEATNSAATLARGEFIAFLDHDDELAEHALLTMVGELNQCCDADLIYSDEDKVTEDGVRHYPHFKSDWNPELLLCQNYVCHFTVVRKSLFDAVGGIRKGFDGAQDWDFVLRVSEATTPGKIRHVPFVLYHWRVIEGSTAKATESKPYVTTAQIKAVSEHLERIGDKGAVVTSLPATSMIRVSYPVPKPEPLVSLIIPTRNQLQFLSTCVQGLLEKTAYKNIEVIIVDNGSDEAETLEYLDQLRKDQRIVVLRDDGPFNFSRLNNRAVKEARGVIIGFINNDIQVVRSDWLHEMVSNVVRKGIGAVGARLLYPNGTVQHAGVTVGIGGVADHMMRSISAQSIGYFCRAVLPQNVTAVTAACMLVKREAFEEIGGFDEKEFSVAYNDVDLCLRLREAGYLIVYTPYAELIHHESISRGYEDTPEKKARFEREFSAMQARWGETLLRDPYHNPNFTRARPQYEIAFPPYHQKPWEGIDKR
jgi:GT2 family glycosyltransferase